MQPISYLSYFRQLGALYYKPFTCIVGALFTYLIASQTSANTRKKCHTIKAKEINLCLQAVSRLQNSTSITVIEWTKRDKHRIQDALSLWSFSHRIDALFYKTINRLYEGIKRITGQQTKWQRAAEVLSTKLNIDPASSHNLLSGLAHSINHHRQEMMNELTSEQELETYLPKKIAMLVLSFDGFLFRDPYVQTHWIGNIRLHHREVTSRLFNHRTYFWM